jgi:hypothetical protein
MLGRTTETIFIARECGTPSVKEKNYRVFRQKMVNIRNAISDILRHGLACECETATSSHLHQFAGGDLEMSERAMSLDIEDDLSMGTHCVKVVLRLASTSSRGWGSSDKNSNSR